MLSKINILQRILKTGVVAVIRAETPDKAERIAKACLQGGINAIEITFTVPNAAEVIKALRDKFTNEELLVGAGTVLDGETARYAILAGAEFIVSPGCDLETVKLCNRYQKPYLPGCMTVNEIIAALEAGADIIKLFPGGAFGPKIIKDIRGPLPQALLMPTGGVSIANAGDWIKAGAAVIGVGSALTKGCQSDEEITEKARMFVDIVKNARTEK